jgi:hypothetical protein
MHLQGTTVEDGYGNRGSPYFFYHIPAHMQEDKPKDISRNGLILLTITEVNHTTV